MARVPMAPTNYAYTRHMLHIAQNGSALDATVVTLPCAWIYCVVGQHLLRKGKPPKSHPYRDWLLLYASPEFAEGAGGWRGRGQWGGSRRLRGERGGWRRRLLTSVGREWWCWRGPVMSTS